MSASEPSKQSKGGMARARILGKQRTSEIARVAAKKRWMKPEDRGEMPEARSGHHNHR